MPNHVLKYVYMLNYGTIKIRTVRIIQAFLLLIFYHISSKHTWFFGHSLEYTHLFSDDNMDEGSE